MPFLHVRRGFFSLFALWLALCLPAGCGDSNDPVLQMDATMPRPDTGTGDVGGDTDADVGDEALAIIAVPETESWQLPGLDSAVHILLVEAGIPHIYAENRHDLGIALGFTVARDRYFVMDLQRRLGLGTVASLLGELALDTDIESRLIGMPFVADRIVSNLSPELSTYLQSFVDGVNVYIDAVKAELAAPPSELEIAAGILGATSPGQLMEPWSVRDVAAMAVVIMYQTTFESDDIARSAAALTHPDLFMGDEHQALRLNGFLQGILGNMSPLFPYTSTPGLGLNGTIPQGVEAPPNPGPMMAGQRRNQPAEHMYHLLAQNLRRVERRLLRHQREGIGSNTWAVAGSHSRDGYTLVAGDGHLPLAVPAVTYQVGLNTTVFGEGSLHQTGILLAQLPVLGVGTNGHVAWSQVNPYADTTDWYREELQLDEEGWPASTTFRGEQRPLIRVIETYQLASVPALGSQGGEIELPRYTTFDGRWITDVEGVDVTPENEATVMGPVLRLLNRKVAPRDLDEDGIITAISMDYAALDTTGFVNAADAMGHARNAEELRQATGGLLGSGLYTAGGDAEGNIMFSSYQATPCRSYLPKNDDGHWRPDANPRFLLDGTQYGGFTMRSEGDRAIEGSADPYQCVVPFDAMPQAYNPDSGYVVAANNDPGNLSTDGRIDDGDWYIGGPWSSTRSAAIAEGIQEGIDTEQIDIAWMAKVQAIRASRLGSTFTPHLLAALDRAERPPAEGQEPTPTELRLQSLFQDDAPRLLQAKARLTEWRDTGYDTPSGVETFYDSPTEADRRSSVATMIFNVWLRQLAIHVWADEGVDDSWTLPREQFTIVSTARLLAHRSVQEGDPLPSVHPETQESIFFDVRGTPELESSDEILVMALIATLDYLSGPETGINEGGFGTPEMEQWLWGLRHQARLESLLASFLGDNPQFSFLLDRFAITTETLPLASDLLPDDPRSALKWFPRGGDQWAPDAANPGLFGNNFTHGNGPVMRMVIALKDGEVKGQNIIPGGQSGLTDSAHFADQAALWLANETYPLRFHPADVVAGATARLRLGPGDTVRIEAHSE